MSSSSVKPTRKRKAATLKEDIPAKLPKCSPRTSKIRRDAFFAGAIRKSERLRAPLSELSSSISNEIPSSPLDIPSSSPLPLYGSSPLKHQLLTPASTPDVSFLKKLQIAASESSDGIFIAPKAVEPLDGFRDIKKPIIRKPLPTSFSFRNLERSLVGYEPNGIHGMRLEKRSWLTQGFYSEAHDYNVLTDGYPTLQMPFCVTTFNKSPLVVVGYECGKIRLMGTSSWGKESRLGQWNLEYRPFENEVASAEVHQNAIFDLSVSQDDRFVATASGDQTCRIQDIEVKANVAVLSAHRGSVKQVNHALHDDNLLLTSSRDSDVHVWDLRTVGTSIGEDGVMIGKPVNSIFGGHRTRDNKEISITAAVWSPRNQYQFATACHNDAVIKVWDIRKSHYLRKSPNLRPLFEAEAPRPRFHRTGPHRDYGITSLSFSPDGSRLYSLCKDGNAYAYSTSHLEKGPIHFYSHSRLSTNSFYVKSSVSHDGEVLATGSSDGVVALFPTNEKWLAPAKEDEANLHTAASDLRSGKGSLLVEGHNGREVTGVAWDFSGNVVSISDDCGTRLWRNDDDGKRAEELRDEGWKNGERFGCGWSDES